MVTFRDADDDPLPLPAAVGFESLPHAAASSATTAAHASIRFVRDIIRPYPLACMRPVSSTPRRGIRPGGNTTRCPRDGGGTLATRISSSFATGSAHRAGAG